MRLIRFTVTHIDNLDHQYAALVNDTLWAHIGNTVEHITVTPAPICVYVTLFLHDDVRNPRHFAEMLMNAVHTASPELRAWDIKTMQGSGDG
jgi:hypothetical protein